MSIRRPTVDEVLDTLFSREQMLPSMVRWDGTGAATVRLADGGEIETPLPRRLRRQLRRQLKRDAHAS